MADSVRAKGSASKPPKVGNGRKVKAYPPAAKNQQPSSPTTVGSTILPRIDRRAPESTRNEALAGSVASPQERDLISPIPIPPRRPSSKAATIVHVENSPTYHGDDIDGPTAKAAWSTPRSPAVDSDRPHLSAFFASSSSEPATSDPGSNLPESLTTPARLKSVEENLLAAEELYRVNFDALCADNDKFFEISTAALQHTEVIQSELPVISDSFLQTTNALHDLSSGIAALHQQHAEAHSRMMEQLERTVDANAEEMVALTEAQANEQAKIAEEHAQEMLDVRTAFETQIHGMEDRLRDTESSYETQLEQLRTASNDQLRELQESSNAKAAAAQEAAQAELKALEASLTEQLEHLRMTSTSEYEILQNRSEQELAELQNTSAAELDQVQTALTSEIDMLKHGSAADITAVMEKASQDLKQLKELKDEELAALRTALADECTRINNASAEEIARLNMLSEEQVLRSEERRIQETSVLSESLQAANTSHTSELSMLHNDYQSRIQNMQDTFDRDASATLAAHTAHVKYLVEKATTDLADATSQYEEKLRVMSASHEIELQRTIDLATLDRESLVTKHAHQVAEMEEDRRRERDALVLGYETDMETLKQSTREQLDMAAKAHETFVNQLRESHAAKVLVLESTLQEQESNFTKQLEDKTSELERCQEHILELETSKEALHIEYTGYVERSNEAMARKGMEVSEREGCLLRLDEELLKSRKLLDDAQRSLRSAEDDRQTKASTILELTLVIKSRDEEVDKLRHSLLDTVKTVNTKTEILELTAESLSSKAKELEATKAALRLESGRLSMVEESMHQKEGMLEDTTLKVESMRLNMENLRLEMKRMQMDMKLQLEHSEGEMELKNGEIRRLHGSVADLKQKNDFCQQMIERLEGSLGIASRQADEAQRRINLLKLEAANGTEELRKTCDLLSVKEQEIVMLTRDKQSVTTEKQRLQLQVGNLNQVTQVLREQVECHAMQTDDSQARSLRLLERTISEKDERLRSEKHLLTLELAAARDMAKYLEGVDERYKNASQELEEQRTERTKLQAEERALQGRVASLEEELNVSRRKVREQSAAIDSLTRSGASVDSRVKELDMEVIKHEEASRQLQLEKRQLQDGIARTTRDHELVVASMNEEKVVFKQELLDREQQLEQIKSDNIRLDSISEQARQEIKQATVEIEKLRLEVTQRGITCDRLKRSLNLLDVAYNQIDQLRRQEQTVHFEDTFKFKRMLATRDAEILELAQCVDERTARTRQLEEEYQRVQGESDNLSEKQRLKEAASKDRLLREQDELRQTAQDERVHLLELNEAARMEGEELRALRNRVASEDTRARLLAQREEHERFCMFNTEYEARLFAAYVAEVATVRDGAAVGQSVLVRELSEVKRVLDEQVEKARADREEWDQINALSTENHQQELAGSAQSVRDENALLIDRHRAELEQLTKEFDHNNEVMRLRLSEEHLLKVNELLERSRVQDEHHAAAVQAMQSALAIESDKVVAATRRVDELMRTINLLETRMTTQHLELASAKDALLDKNAVIASVRKELKILRDTSTGPRSSEQLLALLRQQIETYLAEEHRVKLADLSDFVWESEQDVLDCVKSYFAMRCCCQPLQSSSACLSPTILPVSDVCFRLVDYDRISMDLSRDEGSTEIDLESTGGLSASVAKIRSDLDRLDSTVQRLVTGTSSIGFDNDEVSSIELLESCFELFDKLQLSSQDPEERSNRRQHVVNVMEQYKRLMHAAKSSSERGDIKSLDDLQTLLNKVDAVLARARDVTGSSDFCSLSDLTLLLDECELQNRQMDEFKADSLRYQAPIGRSSSSLLTLSDQPTNYIRTADVTEMLREFATFVDDCMRVLDLPTGGGTSRLPMVDVFVAIHELMSVIHEFETLQPQLGSPRRREDTGAMEAPTLHSKVVAIIALVNELKAMAEFAQGVLEEEREASATGGDVSNSASLASIHSLTRTPTLTVGLVDVTMPPTLDSLELEIQRDGHDGENDPPLLSVASADSSTLSGSPSAFLADSLLDISLVMSDHQRLITETAHLVSKVAGKRKLADVGSEISCVVRDYHALLSLARRLFHVRDARQDLPSILESVAILQRLMHRLTLWSGRDGSSSSSSQGCASSCECIGLMAHSSSNMTSASSASLARSEDAIRASLSVFATIDDVARNLQDYNFLLNQLRSHSFPALSFTDVEALANGLGDHLASLSQVQSLLQLEDTAAELPQIAAAVHEILRQSLPVARPTTDPDNSPSSIDNILTGFDNIAAALAEFSVLVASLQAALVPDAREVCSPHELGEHVIELVKQFAELKTINSELEEDVARMHQAQQEVLEEVRSEGVLLSQLDSDGNPPSPGRRKRVEVLETLIARQNSMRRQKGVRDKEEKREAAFLREHGLLLTLPGDGGDEIISSSTRLAVYEKLLDDRRRLLDDKRTLETHRDETKRQLVAAEVRLETDKRRFEQQIERVVQEGKAAEARLEEAARQLGDRLEHLTNEKQALETQLKAFKQQAAAVEADKRTLEVQVEQAAQTEARLSEQLAAFQREAEAALDEEKSYLRDHELVFALDDSEGGSSTSNARAFSRIKVLEALLAQISRLNQHVADVEQRTKRYVAEMEHRAWQQAMETDERVQQQLAESEKRMQQQLIEADSRVKLAENQLREHQEVAKAREAHEWAELRDFGLVEGDGSSDALQAARSSIVQRLLGLQQAAISHDGGELDQLREEKVFLLEHCICSTDQLEGAFSNTDMLAIRLKVYHKLLAAEALVQDEQRKQSASRQAELRAAKQADDVQTQLKTWQRRVERLESAAMEREEISGVRTLDIERGLQDASARVDSLERKLEMVEAVAENKYKAELTSIMTKHASQLAFLAGVRAEEAKLSADESSERAVRAAAEARVMLLEALAKRDATATSAIYRAIRLATDVLNPSAFAVSSAAPTTNGEVPMGVTQAVLACVKELKALKEFLAASLDTLGHQDETTPSLPSPSLLEEGDKIEAAMWAYRELTQRATRLLIARRESAASSMAELYALLQASASAEAFPVDQQRMLELETDVASARAAVEDTESTQRLHDAAVGRLLEDREAVEAAMAATLAAAQGENTELKSKVEQLEQFQRLAVASSIGLSPTTARSRLTTPRGMTGALPTPMRPERPRDPFKGGGGGGTVHKERFVSELEKETGQRRTTAARRGNEFVGSSSAQLEREFRALQPASRTAASADVLTLDGGGSSAPTKGSLLDQELWYQGVRTIHFVAFFVSLFHVPKQGVFRVELLNSDTEQPQTVYVPRADMQQFVEQSRQHERLPLSLDDAARRSDVADALFERVKVYGEGSSNLLLGFE